MLAARHPLRLRQQGRAQPVGQDAGDARRQQYPPPLQQALQLAGVTGRGQWRLAPEIRSGVSSSAAGPEPTPSSVVRSAPASHAASRLFGFSLVHPPDGWPHDLVARLMPEANTARRETLIQAAVAAAGFPTPVVRAACTHLIPSRSAAGSRLIDYPARPAPDVICHGDLHPFNLLRDGARVTMLDWSTALLAPRSYDVAFTCMALSEPALAAPGWLRPAVRWPPGSRPPPE